MKKILSLGLFVIFFFATMNNVAASEFTENYDINNDWIDSNKDDFYSLEYNSTDIISFGYSSVRYAIFIESNENITKLRVNDTVITSNYEDLNIFVKIVNNRAEFVITKAYFSNPIFAISINNKTSIIIDPFDLLVPPPTPTETTTTTETPPTDTNSSTNSTETPKKGLDLTGIVNLWESPLFWFMVAICAIILMDFKRHPIVFLTENGKAKRIGKYIASYHNDSLNKWENYFSNSSGISVYYSDLEFNGYAQFHFHTWLGIENAYPSLRLIQLPINRTDIIKRVPVAKTPKNVILKIIMGLFFFTPAAGLVRKCSEKLKTTDEILKFLPLIIPDGQLEANEYRFKATYQILELDPESNTHKLVSHEDKYLVYSDIVSLEKANVKELHTELQEVRIIHYPTLKEADEDKRSRLEIINNYEKRILDLEYEYLQLQSRYQLTLADLSLLKRDFNEKIYDELKKVRDILGNQGSDVIEIISDKLEFQKVGYDQLESLKEALKVHSDKSKVDYIQIKEENAKLKGYLEGLAKANKSNDDFNPNEIVFKSETDKNEKDVKKNE